MVLPDAAPANATRISVSTSTNFKGKLEGYPGTGVVRVTDAHPAGTYAVTVSAFDSAGASATKTFMLTVTTPATCNPVRFAATNIAAGIHPAGVAVGDFNGDGNQDLAVANAGWIPNPSNVSILLGNGAGNFSAPTNFGVGVDPTSVAVGDFNGDGNQDLAVANFNSNNVAVLLGNGAGNFSAATYFGPENYPASVAVGDFNGDGRQDLAVANYGSAKVSILLGNGVGTFGGNNTFTVGTSPYSVAIGDFNGDGKQDLAVANQTGTVSILLGDGAGSFSAATNFDADLGAGSVVVGDFNADGNQDLAVANSNSISILLGDGAAHFSGPTTFGADSGAGPLAVGDFNGDGKQDLAAANYNSNSVSILFGDGAGSFSAATNFGAGVHPFAVAVGDFNGDGKQDLAAPNIDSGNVSIMLRVCNLIPTNAASRKPHGTSPGNGTFDVNLPLTGSSGVECRTTGGTNDHTMIVAFSGNVTVTGNPQAQVTMGTGCVGSAGTCDPNGTVTTSANVVTVPLTNVANAQTINVTLNGVSGIGNVVIPMRLLNGDVNGNGAVNAGDVAKAKLQVGQLIDASNFRSDVNANNTINASDVSLVKARSGTAIP